MPEPDDCLEQSPRWRSVTCAICDDPACAGEHVLGDPWMSPPGAAMPEPSPLSAPEPSGLPHPKRWIPPERRDLD